MKKPSFFNVKTLLGYKASVYFVTSERGLGKSYSWCKYALERAIKHGEEFCYIRRTKDELDKCKNSVFAEVLPPMLSEEDKIKIEHSKLYLNGRVLCHFLALSEAVKIKSTPFPNVRRTLLEEFISEKGKGEYLTDEIRLWLSLNITIFRRRSWEAWCLGNEISNFNPYYCFFNIPPLKKKFFDKKRNMLAIRVDGSKFSLERHNTDTARILQGTQEAEYVLNNKNILDDVGLVSKKKAGNPQFHFIFSGQHFTFWADAKHTNASVSMEAELVSQIPVYNVDEEFKAGTYMDLRGSKVKKIIAFYATQNAITFDSVECVKYIQAML